MTRAWFLWVASAVALAVATFALCRPEALLSAKGVEPSRQLLVWVREVGALILATGVTTFLVRNAPDSVALRAVLIGNAVLHLGLLPIELVALSEAVIPKLGGVVPNSILHVVLAAGFGVHARRIRLARP
jgi:hypothetical protein